MKVLLECGLVILAFVSLAKGLECGLGQIRHDRLGQTIATCLSHNKTLGRVWRSLPISESSSSESEGSSSESDDSHSAYRFRRATSNSGKDDKKTDATTTESTGSAEKSSGEKSASNETYATTNCIVQCIFETMNMTNSNGFPDHQKIAEGLASTATRKEMKDFLQETADDCFEEIEKESNIDACTFSSNLITCLADKGKENCEDWPVGNLPF